MNAFDNFSMIGMINDAVKDKIIFHIPHYSISIPSYVGFKNKELENELLLQTDWVTDLIFQVDGIDSVKADFSRLFCDAERFKEDDKEVMAKCGRGALYTHFDSGEVMRELTQDQKEHIIHNFYDVHHQRLTNLVESKMNEYDECLIKDCHSFNNVPLQTDLIKVGNRADICIGTCEHTPDDFVDKVCGYFKSLSFSVEINTPYAGSIVPLDFMQNRNVKSIMIELNKKLYMNENKIDTAKVIQLNQIINNLIDQL